VAAAVQVVAQRQFGPHGTSTTVVPAAPDKPADRPAWLPAKFKSPEDMAQAYSQLEQRMGGGQPQVPGPAPAAPAGITIPESPAPAVQAPPGSADLVQRMTQEYAASGSVSPALRQEFVRRTGLPDSYIDNQVNYMRAQEKQAVDMATRRLGGEQAVSELTQWAAKRLSNEERQAFNQAVYSNNPGMVQLALDGLAAKYEAEVGRSPRVIAGRRPMPDHGGIQPFQSQDQWFQAMKDPRYKVDSAYRQEVEDRLRQGMQLGLV